jgi:hypothetical protein
MTVEVLREAGPGLEPWTVLKSTKGGRSRLDAGA